MRKAYLMRHGKVTRPELFDGPDIPLSPEGREQIEDLAREMREAGVHPVKIVHSPFRRTTESAAIAREVLDITRSETDERLKEWDVGPYLDKPVAEFFAATHYDLDPPPPITDPRIETLEHMAERASAAIKDHLTAEGAVLIVGHREPLVSALLKLQGKDFVTIRRVPFERASCWELEFAEDGELTSSRLAFDRSQTASPS